MRSRKEKLGLWGVAVPVGLGGPGTLTTDPGEGARAASSSSLTALVQAWIGGEPQQGRQVLSVLIPRGFEQSSCSDAWIGDTFRGDLRPMLSNTNIMQAIVIILNFLEATCLKVKRNEINTFYLIQFI